MKRIYSALLLLAVILPLVIIGEMPFALLIGVISMIAIKEVTDLYKFPILVKLLMFLGLLSVVYSNFEPSGIVLGLDYKVLSGFLLALTLPIILFQTAGKYNVKDSFEVIGFLLILGLGLNYLILIRNYDLIYFLFVILIPIITDIFAYTSGIMIGKHKATKLSPNKSWEGYIIGSIMGTFIMTVFYVVLIGNQTNLFIVIGLILALSIVGQLGDLFFSAIKRQFDIKDFSRLIPGHGGVVDRLDSIIFVALLFIMLMSYL